MECQHGYEASVHLLAKEVFKETKTLCLPGFTLRRECKNGNERIQFVAQIGKWGVVLQNVPQTQINNIVFVVALQKIRLTC